MTEIGGVVFDRLSASAVVQQIGERLLTGAGGLVVTPNLDHLYQVRHDAGLRRLINGAALRLADGYPVVWLSRLSGCPLPERVPGSDLIWSLSGRAAEIGQPVFLIGGTTADATEAARRRLVDTHPSLRVSGCSSPEFGFEQDAAALDRLDEMLAGSSTGLVFIGLGFPKQEHLAGRLMARHPGKVFVGCGAAIDMVAGLVRRAPRWVQLLGLEWAYRLAQEPGRLARRYLINDGPYLLRLAAVTTRKRISS